MLTRRRPRSARPSLPLPNRPSKAPLPAHLSYALSRIEIVGTLLSESLRDGGVIGPEDLASAREELRAAWRAVRERRPPVSA